MTLKLCQLREYQITPFFMEKSCKTFAPKAISKRLSDFGKETKTVIA